MKKNKFANVKNTYVQITLTLIFIIATILTSCSDFNMFSWSSPTAESIINYKVDDLLFATYRADIVNTLSDDNVRNLVLSNIDSQIASKNNDIKIKMKYILAKIAVISKGSKLNQIANESAFSLMLDLADADLILAQEPKELITRLLRNVSTADYAKIVVNASLAYEAVEAYGLLTIVSGNYFPPEYIDIKIDIALQAIVASAVNGLYESVVVYDKDIYNFPTDDAALANYIPQIVPFPSREQKAQAVAAYVLHNEYKFDSTNPRKAYVPFIPKKTISEVLVGTVTNPNGTRRLLYSMGLYTLIDVLQF